MHQCLNSECSRGPVYHHPHFTFDHKNVSKLFQPKTTSLDAQDWQVKFFSCSKDKKVSNVAQWLDRFPTTTRSLARNRLPYIGGPFWKVSSLFNREIWKRASKNRSNNMGQSRPLFRFLYFSHSNINYNFNNANWKIGVLGIFFSFFLLQKVSVIIVLQKASIRQRRWKRYWHECGSMKSDRLNDCKN